MNPFFLLALLLITGTISHADGSARPNVLIMVADDLGYGDVGCLSNGKVKTPNIDRLAKSGVKFTSGYVTAPLCAPSRAGFFTGLYQQRFGFLNNEGAIPSNLPLLPGVLREAGYHTGLLGKWHSEGPAPHERGCFDETLCSARPGPFLEYLNPKLARNGKVENRSGYITDILAQEAEDFIERNKANPFFLTVTFNAPHIANVVKPFHIIRKDYESAMNEGRVFDVPKTPTARPGESQKYAAEYPGDTSRADTVATIDALDEAVGKILNRLERGGLEKNTIVLFFGDNGAHPENRSENGELRDYKWSHFEGGIRVPFLASYPGVLPAGLAYSHPVSTLDIFPTVSALTGVVPPPHLDGIDLTPFLKGEKNDAPHHTLFFNTTTHGALRQGQWKLVIASNGRAELFDIESDVREQNDLSGVQPDRVKQLQAEWRTWKAQVTSVTSSTQ